MWQLGVCEDWVVSAQLLCENAVFVYGPLYMELPEFETVLRCRRAIMHKTAATTANIRIRPATAMAMANVRCDTHRASSGVYGTETIKILVGI